MLPTLALLLVVLTGLYFVGLAIVALAYPRRAAQFLEGFARSAGAHYLELGLRLVVGGAFILRAPQLLFAEAFNLFGWILVLTTAGLLFVPWRWHRWFAERTVPQAVRNLNLVAFAALAIGGVILGAAPRGPTM